MMDKKLLLKKSKLLNDAEFEWLLSKLMEQDIDFTKEIIENKFKWVIVTREYEE